MSESVRDLDRGGSSLRSSSSERTATNGDGATPAWLREVADREPRNGDSDSGLAAHFDRVEPPTLPVSTNGSPSLTTVPLPTESLEQGIAQLREEALEGARRDAEAEVPKLDFKGRADSEQVIRDRCTAFYSEWQAGERDRLNKVVGRTEAQVAQRLGQASLETDRLERATNELYRLKARFSARREVVDQELIEERKVEKRGMEAKWYAVAIGFLGVVEFMANAPVFGALLPRDPMTERQLRLVAETSEGWMAGAQRVFAQFILRPDATLLAAGVVTFLCVLAHFFGKAMRELIIHRHEARDRSTVAFRSPTEYLVPMLMSGVGLILVIGVLFVARVKLGEVAEQRYTADSAIVEQLRRDASWLRVDGNLVAANDASNRADDMEAIAKEQHEYAQSMSRLSWPILLLNTTLVLCAISAAYYHTRDRRREYFNESPFEGQRRGLIEAGEHSASSVSGVLAETVEQIRELRSLLSEKPLKKLSALTHQLEAVVALYRAENGRARGLDTREIPAFAGPVELELEIDEEATRDLLMRDPDEYEDERRKLYERYEEVRTRFTREATAW